MSSILTNFFCYYGIEFPYHTTGISVIDGGSLFLKEERGWLDVNQPHMLSIEDPNNIANVSINLKISNFSNRLIFSSLCNLRMFLKLHGIFSGYKLFFIIVIINSLNIECWIK